MGETSSGTRRSLAGLAAITLDITVHQGLEGLLLCRGMLGPEGLPTQHSEGVRNSLPSGLGSGDTQHWTYLKLWVMLVLHGTCDQLCLKDKEHLTMQKEH